MAQITFEEPTNREDLANMVWNASALERAFSSRIGSGRCTRRTHEWPRDTYRVGNADNAQTEDATTITATDSNRQRWQNLTQIMDDKVEITQSQEASDPAGVGSETNYQLAKRYKEIMLDLEARLVSAKPAVEATSGSGTVTVAQEMAGAEMWIFTNISEAGDGATPDYTASTPILPDTAITPGTPRAFTETLYGEALEKMYTNSSAQPSFSLFSPKQKRTASSFAAAVGAQAPLRTETGGQQAAYVAAIDIYVSDWWSEGIQLLPHRNVADTTVMSFDPEYWELCWFQDAQDKPLAETGHTRPYLVWLEATLACRDELGGAKTTDLS